MSNLASDFGTIASASNELASSISKNLSTHMTSTDGKWIGLVNTGFNKTYSECKTSLATIQSQISKIAGVSGDITTLEKVIKDLKDKEAKLALSPTDLILIEAVKKLKEEKERLVNKINNILNGVAGLNLDIEAEYPKLKSTDDKDLTQIKQIGTKNNKSSVKEYPVDKYGIVIKNDGVPRNGTASEKMEYLFPDGIPTSAEEMVPYVVTTYVDYIDESGERKQAQIKVHKKLEEDVKEIFAKIADTGYKMSFEEKAYVESYFWREKRSVAEQSQHSYAAAVDINPAYNPFTPTNREGTRYDPDVNEYAVTEEVANIFRSYGWGWGGSDWTYPESNYDYMHFDFAEIGPVSQKETDE